MTDEAKRPTPAERALTAQESQAAALESLAELFERRDRAEARERQEADRAARARGELRIGHRSELRQMNVLTFARALPPLAELFSRKIPPSAWSVDRDAATIACPCGMDPDPVAEKGAPVICPGDDCGRAYVYDGENVRVGYPDRFQPARAESNAPTSVTS